MGEVKVQRVDRERGQSGLAATRLASYLPVLLALVLPLAMLTFSYIDVIDDAFISYRHARNLVAGRGLVFNSGEQVDGVTNLS